MRHESAVQRFTSGLNHAFQEKVGSFQFVPEEHVRLTQLEGLRQIVLSHHLHSDHVETSKDPTSSRTLLCRRLTLNTDLIRVVRVIVRCHHRTIEGCLGETVLLFDICGRVSSFSREREERVKMDVKDFKTL